MNKEAMKYRALELYLKELNMLFDVYSIPKSVLSELPTSRVKSVLFRLIETSWYEEVKNVMNSDLIYHICRRVDRVVEEIREIRENFLERDAPDCFDNRVNAYITKALIRIRSLFQNNEGTAFDFDLHVDLRRSLPDYIGDRNFGFRIYESCTRWHRGRGVQMHRVKIAMTPRNAMAIKGEWFCFKIKGKSQFVLSAKEIENHMLNDQGVKVHRLDCFGLIDDDPQEYQYYLVQSEGLMSDDGHQIFAHGKNVSSAMALLNRRIKYETLKRLDV